MRYRRIFLPGGIYFFTLVTYLRRPIFTDQNAIHLFDKIIESVQVSHPFIILAHVILPEHIHMIWELPEGDQDYPMRWRLIKSRFSHLYHDHSELIVPVSRKNKQERTIWQRRYWEHTIEDEDDLDNHIDYIHMNPVHHGLVRMPFEWELSSFSKHVQEGRYEIDWTMDINDDLWKSVRE